MVRNVFFYLNNREISRAYYFRLKKSGAYLDRHFYSGETIFHHLCSPNVVPLHRPLHCVN